MKKLFITVAVLAIIIIPQTLHAAGNVFTDVEEGNRFFVPLQYLKSKNLIEGYKDGSFKPDTPINRAEALTLLFQAIKKPSTKQPPPTETAFNFPDVTVENWFYETVLEAWKEQLVKGYPDKRFHPEKTINVAESLKIGLLREGQPIPLEVNEAPYTDVPVNSWFAPYAQIASVRTLFLESRTDGSLGPEGTLSRGEFAQLIYRMMKSNYGSRFARATWYADLLAHQSTASGEPYVPNHYTAAHKTLPFGTKLQVTNLSNGKSIEVTVNDRGPYARGVDLDLSKSAFEAIAPAGAGIVTVEYQEIPQTPPYGF